MLANFFVLWLLLAVGGGFLLFFGGLLASWIGEEMVCFLLATALLALAGALIIQLRERLQQTRRRLEEETDRLRRMEEKLDQLLERERIIRRKVLTPPEKKVEEQTLCPSKNRE